MILIPRWRLISPHAYRAAVSRTDTREDAARLLRLSMEDFANVEALFNAPSSQSRSRRAPSRPMHRYLQGQTWRLAGSGSERS
jgi:hypothetical protein